MTWAPGFSLSLVEYAAIWRHLGLGRQPYPLAVPISAPGDGEQLRVQQEVRCGLADRGLLRSGVLDAELEELIHLVDTHVVAVCAIAGPVRAIAAHDGFSGVLAILDGEMATVRPIRTADLPSAAAEVLPAAVAGRTGIAADRYEQLAVLVGASIRNGSFGVRTAAADGVHELVWFDLPEGRYLAVRDQERLLLVPADHAMIVDHLSGLLGVARSRSVEARALPVGLAIR